MLENATYFTRKFPNQSVVKYFTRKFPNQTVQLNPSPQKTQTNKKKKRPNKTNQKTKQTQKKTKRPTPKNYHINTHKTQMILVYIQPANWHPTALPVNHFSQKCTQNVVCKENHRSSSV